MSTTNADQNALSKNFRQCSQYPELGLTKVSAGPADTSQVNDFLALISETVARHRAAHVAPTPSVEGLNNLQGHPVQWHRYTQPQVFPFYMESLAVANELPSAPADERFPMATGFPGQWFLRADVLDKASPAWYGNHIDAWKTWVGEQAASGKMSGGLSYNTLEIPAAELRSGAIDVRPLTLHAISPDGRGVDRGDVAAQAAIANAFWQTFWATGATRAERGNVFPVAFLPVDRSSAYEFAEPFHERYVSLRRRLFGRSAIVCYALEALTAHKALLFDAADNTFKVAISFDPATAEVTSADILLAVQELNRTGFMDAYTGANKDAFAGWAAHEEQHPQGEPWPYTDVKWTHKIKAAGHGIDDALAKVRASADAPAASFHIIRRVIPYAGCAYLYQVMSEMDTLRRRGKVQDFDGDLIGATNSTFFLNFPEEYSALHSAMNEPVSLLVENGHTRQIRTLRRASFVLTRDGEAFITTRAGNKMNSDVLVFEGESAATTYFAKADRPFSENKFGPLFFGAAVVGDSIVETFEDIATEVPPAGWLTGDSEAFGGRIEPRRAAEVQVRRPGHLQDVPVRHAFAIGPLLLEGGAVVPLGESREEFKSLVMKESLSFDETSELTRTQLPGALLNCEARGVPPTRFPYDWNVTRAPRSAIGVKADGSVVVAVIDGRADLPHSVGATLAELAEIMKSLGCTDAMNMDGGGSSVMFVNAPEAMKAKLRPDLRDGIVSLPSDMGGVERLLPVPLVVCTRKA